jgi:hypothetical protein
MESHNSGPGVRILCIPYYKTLCCIPRDDKDKNQITQVPPVDLDWCFGWNLISTIYPRQTYSIGCSAHTDTHTLTTHTHTHTYMNAWIRARAHMHIYAPFPVTFHVLFHFLPFSFHRRLILRGSSLVLVSLTYGKEPATAFLTGRNLGLDANLCRKHVSMWVMSSLLLEMTPFFLFHSKLRQFLS